MVIYHRVHQLVIGVLYRVWDDADSEAEADNALKVML